jgi:hypothetical protein
MPRRKLVTQADARAMALALPEAHESSHMGTPDFRVRNKIFATVPPATPGRVVLKMTPANLDALVRRDPATFQDVWGGRWVGVELARMTREELQELMADAWQLAAPKSLVKAKARARAPSRR